MDHPVAESRFEAMGCDAHVIVVGPTAATLVGIARTLIERHERRWSRFLAVSELSQLNRAAGSPVLVSAATFDLVERAVDAWRLTDGLFDPTVLGSMMANGYDRPFDLIHGTARRPGSAAVPAPGCAAIEVDPELRAVTLPPGTGLDLGGIAKGRAADLVVDEMLRGGAAGVCVNLGGDLRVSGTAPVADGWVVGIADPFALETTVRTVALARGALVTSARTRRRWQVDGVDRHHLVDPATGRPSDSGVAAVSVIATEATVAEVLAKAALLAGEGPGRELLDRMEVPALMTSDDRRVTRLGPWREYER